MKEKLEISLNILSLPKLMMWVQIIFVFCYNSFKFILNQAQKCGKNISMYTKYSNANTMSRLTTKKGEYIPILLKKWSASKSHHVKYFLGTISYLISNRYILQDNANMPYTHKFNGQNSSPMTSLNYYLNILPNKIKDEKATEVNNSYL